MKTISSALWAIALACGGAVHAQTPMAVPDGAACNMPELLQAWSRPPQSNPPVFGRDTGAAAGRVEQTYRLTLAPCAGELCKAGTMAAGIQIDVPVAGRYRIAVDRMVWIDVHGVQAKVNGLTCEHHGCAPIRKVLQYDLPAGPHWVMLEGKDPLEIGVAVVPALPPIVTR